MQRLPAKLISGSSVLGPGEDCSLCPANGTGVMPRPAPISPSPGLTTGIQLPLKAHQQWWSRYLLKLPPEKSKGMSQSA